MERRREGDPDAGGPAAEFVDTPENTPGDDDDPAAEDDQPPDARAAAT